MQRGRIFYLYSLIICWIKAAEGQHPYCSADGCVTEHVSVCHEYRGLFYMAYGKCLIYDEAKKYCEDRDMVFTSMRTQDFVEFFKTITCVYSTRDIFLIGIRRYSGVWMNPDGSPVPRSLFSNWDDEYTEGYNRDPGHDCAYYSEHKNILWHDWWCSRLRGKFACQSELGQCTHDSVTFHVYSQGQRKLISQNAVVFVGDYFECEHSGRSFYFEKWTFSQVCGDKTLTSIDCHYGECRFQLKKNDVGDKNCQLKCVPKVLSVYDKYIKKSLLTITEAIITVTVEDGGVTYCMSYYKKAHYFHQVNLTFDQAESFCNLLNRSLVDTGDDRNYQTWVARAGRKFSKGSKWYISAASCSSTGSCCYSSYENEVVSLQPIKCNEKAYIICLDKTEDCNPEQINDKEKDPKKVYPIDGKGYVFLRVKVDFYEAIKICETRDMTLPKIYRKEQMKEIYEFADKVQLNKKWWINVKKSFDDQYYNYDGSFASYQLWHKDAKNNTPSNRCTVFGQELMYKWNTYECYDKANVICQHPSPTGISPPKPELFWTPNRITTAILLGCICFVLLCLVVFLIYIGLTYTPARRRMKQS